MLTLSSLMKKQHAGLGKKDSKRCDNANGDGMTSQGYGLPLEPVQLVAADS